MTVQKTTVLPTVAISTSESPDMAALGLSKAHLRDAMAELALQLLSSGTSLAYGGDLRSDGFTELLFDLVARYRGHPHHTGEITVTDYLAWPVHIQMTVDALTAFSAGHEGSADLVFLARDGTPLAQERRLELPRHEPDEAEWTEGLTTMRLAMRDKTQARIVLGGRVAGCKTKAFLIITTPWKPTALSTTPLALRRSMLRRRVGPKTPKSQESSPAMPGA